MKELDQFTVEQLNNFIESDHAQCGDVAALARIALAAKRAEPVAYMCESYEGREYNGHNEFSCSGRGIALYTTPQLNSPAIPEGWIKCSDRMPESNEHKPIAIYTGNCLGQGMFVAIYDEDGFFDLWEGSEITGVTHWMPLPAAPENPL